MYWINRYPVDGTVFLIHWIPIYPLDSVHQPLNNWALTDRSVSFVFFILQVSIPNKLLLILQFKTCSVATTNPFEKLLSLENHQQTYLWKQMEFTLKLPQLQALLWFSGSAAEDFKCNWYKQHESYCIYCHPSFKIIHTTQHKIYSLAIFSTMTKRG